MTTSIDSLMKSSGKFLQEEELNQIQHDLNYLIEENKKLTMVIQEIQKEKESLHQQLQRTPIPEIKLDPIDLPIHEPVKHQVSSHVVHHQPSVTIPDQTKSITIIIDTNKMIYLLLFIILMIIILKK